MTLRSSLEIDGWRQYLPHKAGGPCDEDSLALVEGGHRGAGELLQLLRHLVLLHTHFLVHQVSIAYSQLVFLRGLCL